jgi:hypothetical protein
VPIRMAAVLLRAWVEDDESAQIGRSRLFC